MKRFCLALTCTALLGSALAAEPDVTKVPLVFTSFKLLGPDDVTYKMRIKLPKGLKVESEYGGSVEFDGLGMNVDLELTRRIPTVTSNAKVTKQVIGKLKADIHTFPSGNITVSTWRPTAKSGYESCTVDLAFWIKESQMKAAVSRAIQVCASIEILK